MLDEQKEPCMVSHEIQAVHKLIYTSCTFSLVLEARLQQVHRAILLILFVFPIMHTSVSHLTRHAEVA